MKIILLPTAEVVVEVNKHVCLEGSNPHHCYDIGKVESAIATAFYPGDYPFALGGIARVARMARIAITITISTSVNPLDRPLIPFFPSRVKEQSAPKILFVFLIKKVTG